LGIILFWVCGSKREFRTTQDLLFLDDGNPTDVPGTQMHNFDKMRMIAQVVLKQQEYGLCLRSGWAFFSLRQLNLFNRTCVFLASPFSNLGWNVDNRLGINLVA
jgi:hypothetical protein